ncbi:autotransporter outer membrane beta-barrel domain-containing protein [Candidatus Desulfovibrio trichonymphae]|uniref:Outer membrane autotransporter n=1 Tax=Candidatus Desulfovibrio trichonymphae TaxID=1725232 RepID=A0A1J1DQG4_9BACT|nr:autotransporter outer membrane beta-barrel domain-containing protein [Candidatus Desulfovibrio trichonymphae]BAV91705.1 outer membrane autotransporter [Candidatus Desulfovibrio trichonymphae]BAV91993.1 outer membrane autotransporter [Candidatus Desulfovibrio trichonymphae]BAV92063.1 outer membrane autotransporter [Candidatus Desulfovibrio trichonymphae]BAV92211.1 outer membrane autotransporter [Candidatus Desulfovibrio trichonymphae]
MKRNYVKQFMVTLITITMFTAYPFFTRAEDLNGGGKLPSDLSTGLIDLARGETGGLKKLISDAVELAITSFGGTAFPSDAMIEPTTNLGGYHFKDYAGNNAVLYGNIGNLSEIVFNNNTVTFEVGDNLRGGGVLRAGENQQIGAIDNAIFSNNTVTKNGDGDFQGGGIIGAYRGTIGDISNSIFNDNIVTATEIMRGGGIVGVYGVQEASAIGALKNNIFSGNTVTIADTMAGGGIVGVHSSQEASASIGAVKNNIFSDNTVTIDAVIRGGGIVGVYTDNLQSADGTYIGDITDNIFSGNTIIASGVVGGGIVGADTYSTIGDIVNNVFDNNTVITTGSLWTGGIVGALNQSTIGDIIDCTFTNNVISAIDINGGIVGTLTSTIGDISGSIFADNTITARGNIRAGILYLEDSLTVTDSQFTDNIFTSLQTYDSGRVYGGAITLDTGTDIAASSGTLSLTIVATAGNTTIFRNNEINDIDGKRTNSISIRSTTPIIEPHSNADATLVISPFSGGDVYLYDPIYVEQDNGKTFGMEVTQDGYFYWGGDNKFIVDAPDAEKNIVNLRQYTNTSLMSGFNLDAPNHDFNMSRYANLHIYPGSSMTVHAADLRGMLAFYLRGIPVNNQDNPVLTVTADSISIDGMWPQLDFSGDVEPLQFGDKYYLLRGSTELAGNIKDSGIQTIQHGSLLEFTFQLRKDGDNDFVAELIESDGPGGGGTPVVPGAKSITEGASVGAALANQGADLAAGAGMGSAINSAKEDAWGAFAVVDASSMRYNTGSYIDTSSVNLMAGISRNINTEIGKLTAGAFFEYGGASYDIHGSGNTSYIGGGLLGHLKFNDVGPGHFYTEAAARIGGLNNDYESTRLKDVSGRKASFDTESTYYGIHAGVGYVWNITEEASLDVYGKYFWLHQDGNDATISTGEPVSFDPIDSHRLRGGARFAYAINEYISPYIGAAFEYEFDGKARASVWGYDLKAAKFEGETGIGEAGLVFKPSSKSPWLVDLGVQGYVGKREGVSGSLRVGLEF